MVAITDASILVARSAQNMFMYYKFNAHSITKILLDYIYEKQKAMWLLLLLLSAIIATDDNDDHIQTLY